MKELKNIQSCSPSSGEMENNNKHKKSDIQKE